MPSAKATATPALKNQNGYEESRAQDAGEAGFDRHHHRGQDGLPGTREDDAGADHGQTARDHERDRPKPVYVAARDRSQDHRRDPDEHEGDADPLDAGPEIDEVQRPNHVVDPKGQLQAEADDDRSDERAIEQRRDRGLGGSS